MMIIIAVCALFLGAAVWLFRERQLLVLAELRAAEQAMLAQHQAAAIQAQMQAALAQSAVEAKAIGAGSSGLGAITRPAANDRKIWASLSVNHAVFLEDELKGLLLEFSLVNDGNALVDPGISRSRLVINGRELADKNLVLGKDPPDPRFGSLTAGGRLRFVRELGDLFRSPGTYRLSWRGEGFRSSDVTIRVLPAKPR